MKRAFLILALCLGLLFAGGCTTPPAALRAGPAKVSFTPIRKAVAASVTANADDTALAKATAASLDAARFYAERVPNKVGDGLRAAVAGATKSNDALVAHLLKEKVDLTAEVATLETTVAADEKAKKDYTTLATAAYRALAGQLWHSRIFGFPIAFGFGMIAGAALLFVFYASVKSALAAFRAYFHFG